jgi:hypothetical protein
MISVYINQMDGTQIGNYRAFIDNVIDNCSIFILINSEGSLDRMEIIREVKRAFPNGVTNEPFLIVLKPDSPQVPFNTTKFQRETEIDFSIINQILFEIENKYSLSRNLYDCLEKEKIIEKIKIKKIKKGIDEKTRPQPTHFINPYDITDTSKIYLREKEIRIIKNAIEEQKNHISLRSNSPATGKSFLISKILQDYYNEKPDVTLIQTDIDDQMRYFDFILKIDSFLKLSNPELLFGTNDLIDEKTREELLENRRTIIFIDGFELIENNVNNENEKKDHNNYYLKRQIQI